MKKITLIIIITFIFIGFSVEAQQVEMLTNESVIEMYDKKLPTSIIIGKIKFAQNSFKIGTDDLVMLIENKIPEEIVNLIIEAANDNLRHFVEIDPNNPLDMHESGIYYCKKEGENIELIQLDPTIYSQSKSKGGLAFLVTSGLSKITAISTLAGSKAQLQITEKQPEFYFYFDVTENSLSQTSNWWFSAATSPNEFMLAALKLNNQTRELTTGSASLTGSSSGIDDKNRTDMKVEKVAKGIYRVFFEKPLSGEYCFTYAGSIPAGFTNQNKVYDFGIFDDSPNLQLENDKKVRKEKNEKKKMRKEKREKNKRKEIKDPVYN